MNERSWEKYDKLGDAELFSILTSQSGEYQYEAIEMARKILIQRGHSSDFKDLFINKFGSYSDEALLSIARGDEKNRPKAAIEAVNEILAQRGLTTADTIAAEECDIDKIIAQGGLYKESEAEEESSSYIPLLAGIILIVINSYISRAIFLHTVNGGGYDPLIYGLRDLGLLPDILLRILVIGLIIYYRKKQKGSNLVLWVLAGIAFGAWALLVVGIIEVSTSYPKRQEKKLD